MGCEAKPRGENFGYFKLKIVVFQLELLESDGKILQLHCGLTFVHMWGAQDTQESGATMLCDI